MGEGGRMGRDQRPNAEQEPAAGQVPYPVGKGGRGVCRPYDGPALAWLVKACTAPDGSYWALQSWRRLIRGYGGTTRCHRATSFPLARPDPAPGDQPELGRRRVPPYLRQAHLSRRRRLRIQLYVAGQSPDSYGRNIYVDTFHSRLGKGWHRVGGFLTHHRGHTRGDFCYGFYPRDGLPGGNGTKYRATVEGPGVTPDVMWEAHDIGPFDQLVQDNMRALERSWGDPKCRV